MKVSRFGRGEGVVVITLKPLDAALADHDYIYGTVRRSRIVLNIVFTMHTSDSWDGS